eukprot:TRINITY_DN290_c5_g1_i5.p1 TRINITY_DN290_c5_g1~~TRINITY_DN290_c5_g1_i5.p1  ORF type:complete len:477 (+),score=96.56 TRINITY_DN290_c5_g1_i5:166-1596(+)
MPTGRLPLHTPTPQAYPQQGYQAWYGAPPAHGMPMSMGMGMGVGALAGAMYPPPPPPPGSTFVDVGETEQLRGQVSSLAQENEALRAQLVDIREQLAVGGCWRGRHDGGSGGVTIIVENRETRQRRYLPVDAPIDAGYVMDRARQLMDLPVGEYVCRWQGCDVQGDAILHGLRDGDTVVVKRSAKFYSRHSPMYDRRPKTPGSPPHGAAPAWVPPGIAPTPAASRAALREFRNAHAAEGSAVHMAPRTPVDVPRGRGARGRAPHQSGGYGYAEASYSRNQPPRGAGMGWDDVHAGGVGGHSASRDPRMAANNEVLQRLRAAAREGQEHLTVALWLPAPQAPPLVARAREMAFAGFARPHAARADATELVLQGSAPQLAPFVFELVDAAESSRAAVELVEVKGYIPVLTTGFRVTDSFDEGVHMWEAGCEPCQVPGAGRKAWFYRSIEGIDEGLPGIIVIDERAPHDRKHRTGPGQV